VCFLSFIPGQFNWHCHILSHEDHEMMRVFEVGPLSNHMHGHFEEKCARTTAGGCEQEVAMSTISSSSGLGSRLTVNLLMTMLTTGVTAVTVMI
jgi:Multicopper oxidase